METVCKFAGCFQKAGMMKKKEVFVGRCVDYTYDGLGVVRDDDFVFFVSGLIVGEEAKLAAMAIKKNYGYARVVEILKESPHRRNPACSAAHKCGGCTLMHMDFQEQKHFKENKVKRLFLQNAHMDLEINPLLEGEKTAAYRNKVLVPMQVHDGHVNMGFYQRHSNRIIPFDRCIVQTEESNAIVQFLREKMEALSCGENVRHVLVKHAHVTNHMMVCLVVRQYPFIGIDVLRQDLVRKFPQITSVLAMVNRREDNVILSGEEIVLYGDAFIEEELMGCRFRISARSFFQINPYATKILYKKVLEMADLNGLETAVDLYCGTGTIGILMAKCAKAVYGIEIVEEAIADAKVNAEINGIHNIQFMAKDAKNGAMALIKQGIRPHVIVVDPPRKGCSKETLDAIIMMAPKRLVYVSCDPATLARDCAYMQGNGYMVQSVQPVDLFPNTIHVETVVKLSQKHIDHSIRVELDLDQFDETPSELRKKATYKEIKQYILDTHGVKVSTLYISQIKRKCGLEVGECYNKSKSERIPAPVCPPDKEELIKDALRHFKLIE